MANNGRQGQSKTCVTCRHCTAKEVTPKKRRWHKQGKPATHYLCTAVRSMITGEIIVAPCNYRRYRKPDNEPGECNKGQLWEPRTNG